MAEQSFGIMGLAVMGQNLALNVESKGFPTAVYNRTGARTKEFIEAKGEGKNIVPSYTVKEFVNSLEPPRKILLMVKAGPPVDAVIQQIRPLLAKGDIIIDGGNSFFKDTERRAEELTREGLMYIGTGISGGEYGALHGPCIMPGGQEEAYRLLEPILTQVAAKVNGDPCCTYIGPRGAGHYVKMVHNGIEYGVMQLIAESYDLMKGALDLSAQEMGEIFGKWTEGDLGSYLMEITTDILAKMDEETDKPIVDFILDKAGQKGTGKWTSQDALDVGVPTPTINAAVEARILSAFRDERVAASEVLSGPQKVFEGSREELINRIHDALYASVICSYAQGMVLLRWASQEYEYGLNLSDIARIWRGGCIIRSKLLEPIRQAFTQEPDLPNLLLAPHFRELITKLQDNWRLTVQTANASGIPCLAMSASLAYFDSYRHSRLPANLIQAQRDYFGAHTYERVDKEGIFHTEWLG
jgi:6-phosphogluconate dehydrogenase